MALCKITLNARTFVRNSIRSYKWAIAGVLDQEADTAAAYAPCGPQDQKKFDFWTRRANAEVGQSIPGALGPMTQVGIDHAKAKVEGGLEGFYGRLRADRIGRLDARIRAGVYQPQVLAWSLTEANANKAAMSWARSHLRVRVIPNGYIGNL